MKLPLLAGLAAAASLAIWYADSHAFGRLSLYSDPAFTACTLSDAAPGVASIYVVETADISVAVWFRVTASSGFTGVWLSDATTYSKTGSSQTGLGVHFNKCLSGTWLVATITYQLFGTSTCSQLAIAPGEGLAVPVCFDCFDELPCFNNTPLHVNCNDSFDCNPVAVEPSTWGHVKALYRR